MKGFINENTVMQFYLDQMEQDNIIFLKGKDEKKAQIRKFIEALMAEEKMNNKIQIACSLWKALFEASMSYISPNKQGYDKIFKYFDSYVEFEELIFASDSFYRDHTLHCIWVYFLGEYIRRNEEFKELFAAGEQDFVMVESLVDVMRRAKAANEEDLYLFRQVVNTHKLVLEYDQASRCVAALTHDLGYPLKKVEKINKSIKKVLPYFSINNFDDFTFEYENIQQSFVNQFIDFLSRDYAINLSTGEKVANILSKIFKFNDKGGLEYVRYDEIDKLTEEELGVIADSCKIDVDYRLSISKRYQYSNDFEQYKHGIMSAFLLCKNLPAFQNVEYDMNKDTLINTPYCPSVTVLTLGQILSSITDHTNDVYKIDTIDWASFLTFVDELEEFSRISRASQNREYVKEFCNTAIYMQDGWLNIDFEFDNANLDNLDPEISFKGRCKRFLTLFDIVHLNPSLKIRVSCIGKIPNNQNTYVLEIANKYANILINGEEQNIPKYLKSSQFYTKEEYALL